MQNGVIICEKAQLGTCASVCSWRTLLQLRKPLPFLLRFPAGPSASSKEHALLTAPGSKGAVQREYLSTSLHHSTF